jgi:hypothetical protein
MMTHQHLRPLLVLALTVPWLNACQTEGCLGNDDPTCVVPSPCEALTYTCDAGFAEVSVWTEADTPPGAVASLVAIGDFVLQSDKVHAVIDALDHPHYVGPTGGNLLDLSTTGLDNDALRQIVEITGVLPDDAANYTDLRILDTPDGIAAVQAYGHLDGRPNVRIASRYEVRACEPGIRVRTELVHDGADPLSVFLSDGYYWGGREHLAFTPYVGAGFEHPSFGLTTIGTVLRNVPYLVAGARPDEGASYAEVSCNTDSIQGFQSEEISAVGIDIRVLMPGDALVFERFIGVSDGPSVSGAADIALDVRKQLFDEPYAVLKGTVTVDGGNTFGLGTARRAQVLISEGTSGQPASERTPWTHVIPNADGTFEVRVPADRTYVIEADAFGHIVDTVQVDVGTEATAALTLPATGAITLDATIDGLTDHVQVFFAPTTEAAVDDLVGQFLGHFDECAPLLGHPHGSSPACNRVLVNGPTTVLVPPGNYSVFAVAGPFSSLARIDDVVVTSGGEQDLLLELEMLAVQPEGTMSADFHVHGGRSFDSAFNNADRAQSFLAARLEMIATTEHDVVGTYAQELDALDAGDRIVVIDGTESTGHILFPMFPESDFPKVAGHFIFWPVPYDEYGPWRGAPWDELAEPAELMDRMVEQGWDPEDGVAQLNHPFGGFQFGRDFGWAESIGLDLTEPLKTEDDGTGQAMFLRQPPSSAFSNASFDVQEIMNGSANLGMLPYRALWFYQLNQGVVRGGTANSDTHSLTENVVGFPRNLVRTDSTVADFNSREFHGAVKRGAIMGTNGPVLEISTTDDAGAIKQPSVNPFTPGSNAALTIRVTAAPWVPVQEVRIWVNGALVDTLTDLAEASPEPGAYERLNTTIPLADLLPASGDAWIVVEAGAPLAEAADLDCNGFPDTTDNNGDGAINWKDVTALEEEPDDTACLGSVGPLNDPPAASRGEPGYAFGVVVPGGSPMAFTNPLILDRDGQAGFTGVP